MGLNYFVYIKLIVRLARIIPMSSETLATLTTIGRITGELPQSRRDT